jgi:hypothetical protein
LLVGPSAPAHRDCSRPPGAAPSGSARRSRPLPARRAPACRRTTRRPSLVRPGRSGQRAVGEQRVDRQHMVAHDAVADRAGAAGVVARHAAERRPRGRGDVDRKPQPMGFERPVEFVQHDAGLDDAAPVGGVDLDDAVEMPRRVEDERFVDRLAALRGAATARQNADAGSSRDGERRGHVGGVARRGDGDRHHLVMRGIGRIAPAREAVEPHLALQRPAETLFQSGPRRHETSVTPAAGAAPARRRASAARKRTPAGTSPPTSCGARAGRAPCRRAPAWWRRVIRARSPTTSGHGW